MKLTSSERLLWKKYKQQYKYLWYSSDKKDFWQVLFKQFLKTLPKRKSDPNIIVLPKGRLAKLRVEAKNKRIKMAEQYKK